jgi:cytoskeletal protein RodZ
MGDIGSTLQEARMRAQIDISDVEAATKIRAKYLRAMENEEWDRLPGPTFVRSFLRTYAEHLGLDARLLVDEYRLHHEGPPEQEPLPITANLGQERRAHLHAPRISRGWVVGLSLAGLLVALAVLGSLSEEEPAPTRQVTRPVTRPARPTPPPRPTRVSLRLIPEGVVYACVRNGADELLLSDTLEPGGQTETYTARRLRVTLGNNSVRMRVNGRTMSVPSSAEAINYELTPTGRRRLSQEENAC